MDSNNQHLDSSEYYIKRLLEIQYDYAVDGELPDESVDMINDPSGPVALNDGVVTIAVNETDKEILRAFHLENITYYIASSERHRERMILFERLWKNEGLHSCRTVVLVLLVRGYWGIAVTEQAKKQIQAWHDLSQETLHPLQNFHTLKKLKELFEDEEHFRSVGMNEQEAATPQQYILKKVTFEFQSLQNPGAKKLKIAVPTTQYSINPIASIILQFFHRMTKNPHEAGIILNLENYDSKTHQRRLEKPHFLFCYNFIQFLDKYTNLNKPNLSRTNQFEVYEDLLRNAGFTINTDPNGFDTTRSNLEKWYGKGKRMFMQIYRT